MKRIALSFLVVVLTAHSIFAQGTGTDIANKPSGGSIGTAATTVDKLSLFNILQTTANQTITIPNPTVTNQYRMIEIRNKGTVSFTLVPGGVVDTSNYFTLTWIGSKWVFNSSGVSSGSGGSGDIDGVTANTWLTGGGTTGSVILNVDTAFAASVTDVAAVQASLNSHTSNTSNPHSVTKSQVGLGNADNTSDASKPVSSAAQTALNGKENTITATTTADYFRGDKTFQLLNKAAVGLGNIDNTSDVNKPVSTAQAAALNLKHNLSDSSLYATKNYVNTIASGKQNAFGSQSQNSFYAGPTSGSGVPSFRSIIASDIPTLNQNTTGNAATVTTNANLTGPITSTGNVTSIASQTGTGTTFVMSASPALTGTPTAPTQSANDNSTKIATTAYVATAVSAVSGSSTNNQRVGNLFSDNLTSSSNYTLTATSGSQTFASGGCTFTGGNNTFTANIAAYNYNTIGTNFENYSITSKFVSSANSTGSYGIAFGVTQPFSNATYCVAMNTNSAGSRGTVYLINQTSGTVLLTSTNVLSYANTDTLEVELKYSFINITAIVRNLTVPTRTETSVTVPNTVTVSFARATVSDRYSTPAIYSLGGTQVVRSLTMSTSEISDPDLIIAGDSRVNGVPNLTSPRQRYASLIGAGLNNKYIVWAKGGNTTANLNSMFPEIASLIKIKKKTFILLAIGVNDVLIGNSLATFQSDYLSLLQKCEAAGLIPITVKIAYVNTSYASAASINTAIAAINTWIGTLSYRNFDENAATTVGGVLGAAYTTDYLHFNIAGNAVIAEALKVNLNDLFCANPTFITNGSLNYTTSPTQVQDVTMRYLTGSSNATSAIYLQAGSPLANNYAIAGNASSTQINVTAGGLIGFYTGAVQRAFAAASNWQFYNIAQTSGNPTQFYLQASANTGQTAGAGFKLFHADLAATIQHASNTAVTADKAFYISAPTIAFASSGGTSTDPTTFEVSSAPIAGTNATLTRSWAARFLNGNTAIGGSAHIGDATGTTAPTSTLQVGGSFAAAYSTKSANYTLTASDYFINVTATATITLPTAVGISGRIYIIKSSAGTTTLATTSAQTVDGSAPGSVIGVIRLVSDGANWLTF